MMLTNNQIRTRLFESLKNSLMKKTVVVVYVLLVVLIVTAFFLISTRNNYRIELTKQKDLITESGRLDEQWSQIVLEYSSLAAPTAVEQFANKDGMALPTMKNIVFLDTNKGDTIE